MRQMNNVDMKYTVRLQLIGKKAAFPHVEKKKQWRLLRHIGPKRRSQIGTNVRNISIAIACLTCLWFRLFCLGETRNKAVRQWTLQQCSETMGKGLALDSGRTSQMSSAPSTMQCFPALGTLRVRGYAFFSMVSSARKQGREGDTGWDKQEEIEIWIDREETGYGLSDHWLQPLPVLLILCGSYCMTKQLNRKVMHVKRQISTDRIYAITLFYSATSLAEC